MATRAVLTLARDIARDLEQSYQNYLDACDSYRRNGYRPHYCEHGMNLHVDYDPICGPCEDGRTMGDGLQRREFALAVAKERNERSTTLYRSASLLKQNGIDVDMEAVWERITDILKNG